MVDARVLAFAGIAALLTLTPGADTMLVVRSALVRGRRAGLLTVLGVGSGLFVHATLSAVGLSALLVRSARAFELVKLAGALYLVFLGVQALRAAARPGPARAPEPAAAGERRAFLEGLLTNVLNPKVAVFYLAFLPQFIGPGDPVLRRSILLASIHFAEGLVWLSLVTLFVARLRPVLARPGVQRGLEGVTGAVFIAFGVRLATSRS
ncbi:LysE family translocator [Anaeromyxobacter diazotrophicus]|uniref:Lysine transporter LysE n=1 Tax=Anaeromyxobacter diazotrophicus TaxID=2590199 RepID=A0A7I9VQS9_9BACT|nr:LysE family translocator [Anaeromyxobacter diazotrophicus]GEJ58618.1 lysine transporter LysE [Anaeromyxobacter diazotrophicus]